LTRLLDLNVLLALAWPSHIHHGVVHRWFRRLEQNQWASCPLTQLGFIRLSSNPAFTSDAVSPSDATHLLDLMITQGRHEFWPDDLDCQSAQIIAGKRILGHRQVTDAYLLSLAISRDGILATFDKGILQLVPKSTSIQSVVELIDTSDLSPTEN
jgi:toxin-antitoxin system PIN domain toxin